MRRPLLLLLFVAGFLPAGASAQQAASVVDVIKIDGVIDRPMADYLIGSIEKAEAEQRTVVIQLNTPGTLGVSATGLAERIANARVPIVAWVGPPGAQAPGAGLLIVGASSLASVSPGSSVGPPGPLDLSRPGSSGETGSPLTAQQAIDEGIVPELQTDKPAPATIPALLSQIDGKSVPTAGGDVTLKTAGSDVVVSFHDLGPWRRVLHAVVSPVAVYVLLVLGLAGIAFELTQPGFGFAGICGVLALALAAYGLWVVPPLWWAMALLVAGVGLMVADVLLRRLGMLTALGVAAFGAGSIFIYRNVAPAIDISPWLIGGAVVASLLYYGFGLTVAQQARERIASTQRGLVGLVGETRGELDPEGAVHVKGALWRGRTVDEPIPAGTRVRVRGVDGLILRVEAEPEEDD